MLPSLPSNRPEPCHQSRSGDGRSHRSFLDAYPFMICKVANSVLQSCLQLIYYQLHKGLNPLCLWRKLLSHNNLSLDLSLNMTKLHAIPERFTPGYIDKLDGRTAIAVDMRARWTELTNDLGGADRLSYAQRSLVERALWIEHFIAIQEHALAAGGDADMGRMTQATNSLLGLYRTLGLERRVKDVTSLASYIADREAS